MRHTTLYRKWRPRKFGEISGQEAVVRTLRRAIETDRVSHAYLFSGPRGTGKTSSAKVLAMGLNCRNSDGPTPEPCGECGSCTAVLNNSSLDIVEMDAASNRGIDEIRDLRDRVNLAPASGRFKVYIIDEVHMLTEPAFNALLKTLEEPPEQVVFILATTDKHKVPATIISRCQSFEFRRPGIDVLSGKLSEIAEAEGIEVEPEALTIVARAGGGSFRDSEGLLDQLSSFSEGKVTASQVRELLGSTGPETLVEMTDALAERRVADALHLLEELSNEGRDLGRFARELTGHLRNLMLLPHAPEVALAEVGADEKEDLREQSGRVPTAEAVRTIEALGEATGRIRRGSDAKLELELTFMKLARDYTEPSVESLLSRLETLENAAHNGVTPASPAPSSAPVASQPASPPTSPPVEVSGRPEAGKDSVSEKPKRPEEPVAEAADSGVALDPASEWPGIMQELKRRKQALTAAVYGEARVKSFDGESLVLVFADEGGFYTRMAREKRHSDNLLKVLEERFGSRPRIEVGSGGNRPPGEDGPDDATPPGGPTNDEPLSPGPGEPDDRPDDEPPPEENPPSGGYAGGINASAGSGAGGRPPEAAGGDGRIRDQREVFQMAREHFGPF
ncbi:DNA polymerase III subunit gamma/tau [Rubrobacter indicoceani]|uniref:DNA polymerase III subunit gamma/tau n=1 Tax=Rubrobacter indicoceani TaxID=2051957 RepID=UPI0013C4279B|nr:DNA polymerase III subunit gamma/tau [Rubrobacter indicoceani]